MTPRWIAQTLGARPVECLSAEGGPPVSSPEGLSCCAGDQSGPWRARPQAAPNWTKEISKPLWLLDAFAGRNGKFPDPPAGALVVARATFQSGRSGSLGSWTDWR